MPLPSWETLWSFIKNASHRRRLAQLEQQALETQDQTAAETNILWAQLAGSHQEVEWAHQQKERLEDQLQEVGSREEKAQKELQTSRENAAKLTGEMALLRTQMGDLEDELARIRKTIRSRARTESSASGKAEAANSKTLTSSIAQMTIGTAPPVMTTPTTRQAAATHATNTTAAAGSQPSTYAGSADVTTPTAQSAVQMATGSPYPTPLPPPGFPYLSTVYPPNWGMYPYLYPQYVPPMPAVPLGGNLTMMNTTSSTPGAEWCPTQASVEPTPDTLGTVTEPSPSRGEVPGLPAAMYDDMPPLEGQEDSDESSEVEAQGAVCTIAPVPNGRGYR